jgi:hypothetical protein
VSKTGVQESVTIPALPEQVRVVRVFVAGVLGRSHPHADVAVLLASDSLNLTFCSSCRFGGGD